MILKKAPKLDSVFFSNNDIDLHVQSELGSNHFFEVEISVDGNVFDKQSWSKINDVDCLINLKGLFDNVFTNPFALATAIEVIRKDNLQKQIEIVINEYNVDTLLIVATANLPAFFILQNSKATLFDETEDLTLLSQLNALNKIDATSNICIPLWVNKESIYITIADNNGQEKYSATIATTKGLYQINVPISEINVAGVLFLTIKIDEAITLVYYFKDHFRYSKNEFAVRNVYGFYEFTSFFGKITKTPKYKRTIQENYRDEKTIVDETNDISYKLNTGYLSNDERQALDFFSKAKETYFLENNRFRKVIMTTPSILERETNVFAEDNTITFDENDVQIIEEADKYTIL